MTRKGTPGVTREQRISDEGLQRLEKQLESGARMSDMVLRQWVKRYGEPVIRLLERYGRLPDDEAKTS